MIKGYCFVSDDRYKRMGEWCRNSFLATNPYGFQVIELEKTKDWKYAKWHEETKDHPFRKLNPFGMLKFLAALEVMHTQNLERLIILGADVFVVGSFQGIEGMDYELLHSKDLGQAPGMPLNPDVIVVKKTFLEKSVKRYLDIMNNSPFPDNTPTYQEMYILNDLVNKNEVTNASLAATFRTSEECWNKNVRTSTTFSYNQDLDLLFHGNSVVRTIHIQTGLGGSKEELDAKLINCLNTYPAFSPEARRLIEKLTKDRIWN